MKQFLQFLSSNLSVNWMFSGFWVPNIWTCLEFGCRIWIPGIITAGLSYSSGKWNSCCTTNRKSACSNLLKPDRRATLTEIILSKWEAYSHTDGTNYVCMVRIQPRTWVNGQSVTGWRMFRFQMAVQKLDVYRHFQSIFNTHTIWILDTKKSGNQIWIQILDVRYWDLLLYQINLPSQFWERRLQWPSRSFVGRMGSGTECSPSQWRSESRPKMF